MTMNKQLILFKHEQATFSVEEVGGKAANLFKFAQADLSWSTLPKSLIIPVEYHKHWLRDKHLPEVNTNTLFDLGVGPWIVRSSSRFESSDIASPGLFASIVFHEPEGLFEAMRRVYESANNLALDSIHMGMIVQPYIELDLGVVATSHHPEGRSYRRCLIQLGPQVPPVDYFEDVIWAESDGNGYLLNLGFGPSQGASDTYDPNTWIPPSHPIQLDDLTRIVNYLQQTEDVFNMPVEMEMVYDRRQLIVLQVRPLIHLTQPEKQEAPIVQVFGEQQYPHRVKALVGTLIEKPFTKQFGVKVEWSEPTGKLLSQSFSFPSAKFRLNAMLAQQGLEDIETLVDTTLDYMEHTWIPRILTYRDKAKASSDPLIWLDGLIQLFEVEFQAYFSHKAWSTTQVLSKDIIRHHPELLETVSIQIAPCLYSAQLAEAYNRIHTQSDPDLNMVHDFLLTYGGQAAAFDLFDRPSFAEAPHTLFDTLMFPEPIVPIQSDLPQLSTSDLAAHCSGFSPLERALAYCLWYLDTDNRIKEIIYREARILAQWLGEYLKETGVLWETDDIWDLTVSEITALLQEQAISVYEVITKRRNPWEPAPITLNNKAADMVLGKGGAFKIEGPVLVLEALTHSTLMKHDLENYVVLIERIDAVTAFSMPAPKLLCLTHELPISHASHVLRRRSEQFPTVLVTKQTSQHLQNNKTVGIEYVNGECIWTFSDV